MKYLSAFFTGKGMSGLTAGSGDGENGPEACMETERKRTMVWNQGQVVGGAVKSVSHRESKFLSLYIDSIIALENP
jgi:hypothetical protein